MHVIPPRSKVPAAQYIPCNTHLVSLSFRPQAVLQYYWRRAWRIAPAFWVSLAVTHFLMLRGRASAAAIPEADSALFHYPEAFCPSKLLQTIRRSPRPTFAMGF